MRKLIRNPLFLFYILVLYVVTQFSWWLYLIASLYGKLYTDPQILEKKTMMLVGEGSVFILILFGGVFMIRRAYQKENELSKQQENFLLSVSHELKTPISSVILSLQTLKKRELPSDKRETLYDQGLNEMQRLQNIVSNLLLTRSIENKNYFLNKSPINLRDFFEQLLRNLQATEIKNHTVKLEIEETEIIADADSLTSIFSNLIQNAAKYSSPNDEIKVVCKKEKGRIKFTITDNGIGIPDEKKLKVFQRFYRNENEMTRQSKGTGLGLFICKYLVEAHNGSIQLKDNQPKGLIVEISLPEGI